MIDFLRTNLATIIISIILLCVVAAIIVTMRKNKKAGKTCSSCGCGCSSCPNSDSCHKD